jgi:hypothetical protein
MSLRPFHVPTSGALDECWHLLPVLPCNHPDKPCQLICAVCHAVLCCAVLCCAVLCCAVLCCAVLCCAVLCCAVLCCAPQGVAPTRRFALVPLGPPLLSYSSTAKVCAALVLFVTYTLMLHGTRA